MAMPNHLVIGCLLVVVIACAASAQATSQQKSAATKSTLFKPTHQTKPLRVLGLFPFNGFSHFQMFKGIMMALAKRGHHVTVVSPFKEKNPVPNYNVIDLSDEFPSLVDTFTFDFAFENLSALSPSVMTKNIVALHGPDLCRKTFSSPKLKNIFSGKEKFDVIFTEIFGTDCFLAVGHKLKVPTIAVASTYNYPWTADFVGDVDNPAFVETMYLDYSPDKLNTFCRRLINTKLYIEGKLSYYFHSVLPSEAVVREFFGDDVPSFAELKRNVSLVMANSHDILLGPKPSVPRYLPLSGVHLQEPDFSKVPKDIQTFLDTAPNGVVYFTLGSLVRSDSLNPHMMKALTGAFARLEPLRILWKYESSAEIAKKAGVPDNVMVAPWLPQMEILAHPNVRGFMTHGGLMGSLESLYNGVPMVGLPIFGDQVANIAKFEALGVAVGMDPKTLDEETIYNVIKKVVYDPKIRANINELSTRFRDRPVTPADAAVWWTEYVVRHAGAQFLESPGSALPLYQYLLLDVIGAIFLALAAGIVICVLLIKITLRSFRSIFQSTSSSKKKN